MLAVVLLGLALSMDAFAVAIGLGIRSAHFSIGMAFKTAFLFGLSQALMPLVGYGASVSVGPWLEAVDHWIAFGLLAGIGGKMFFDQPPASAANKAASIRSRELLLLALATSIDALAAGFTLHLLTLHTLLTILWIGVVTFALSLAGYIIGIGGGIWLHRYAGPIGGLMLIAIGCHILIEHTWAP
ncbi:MAG: manganese efflux pump [Leptospiraceae bacterium]|nr:manganese efflux pump [Leptospiraceae bacterium]